jgi:hypothetical protein
VRTSSPHPVPFFSFRPFHKNCATVCTHACAPRSRSARVLQRGEPQCPVHLSVLEPLSSFSLSFSAFPTTNTFYVFTFGFCRATSSRRRLPQYDHPQPRTPTDATPSPLNLASPVNAAAGKPSFPSPPPSPPPPTVCVNPVIDDGVVTALCGETGTCCCDGFYCKIDTELKTIVDGVPNTQTSSIYGEYTSKLDQCCIPDFNTDVTELACPSESYDDGLCDTSDFWTEQASSLACLCCEGTIERYYPDLAVEASIIYCNVDQYDDSFPITPGDSGCCGQEPAGFGKCPLLGN